MGAGVTDSCSPIRKPSPGAHSTPDERLVAAVRLVDYHQTPHGGYFEASARRVARRGCQPGMDRKPAYCPGYSLQALRFAFSSLGHAPSACMASASDEGSGCVAQGERRQRTPRINGYRERLDASFLPCRDLALAVQVSTGRFIDEDDRLGANAADAADGLQVREFGRAVSGRQNGQLQPAR